jgi:transposase
VAQRLDVIPLQFRVLVIRRPKYACRTCPGTVVQAPAPPRLIEGGLPTEALVAHVIVAKYADHTPLYRQAQIYARQGIDLDRSTLADWTGRGAWWLRPLHGRLLDELRASPKLFANNLDPEAYVADVFTRVVCNYTIWAVNACTDEIKQAGW